MEREGGQGSLAVRNLRTFARRGILVLAALSCAESDTVLSPDRSGGAGLRVAGPVTVVADSPNPEVSPDVWSDTVVWAECVRGFNDVWGDWSNTCDIFVATLPGDAMVIGTTTSGEFDLPYVEVSENFVVWGVFIERENVTRVYAYDLSSPAQGARLIDTNPRFWALDRGRLVWLDLDGDVYLLDLTVQGSVSSMVGTIPSSRPFLSDFDGDRIVWTDFRNGNGDIYMFDLSTSSETALVVHPAEQRWGRISGNRLAWEDERNGDTDVFVTEIGTGVERQLTVDPDFQGGVDISESLVVWVHVHGTLGPRDVMAHDLLRGTDLLVARETQAHDLRLSGNRVVWVDRTNGDGDIHTATIPLFGPPRSPRPPSPPRSP